jgi:hypothetical protein
MRLAVPWIPLIGVHLIGVHLIGVHLIGVHLYNGKLQSNPEIPHENKMSASFLMASNRLFESKFYVRTLVFLEKLCLFFAEVVQFLPPNLRA